MNYYRDQVYDVLLLQHRYTVGQYCPYSKTVLPYCRDSTVTTVGQYCPYSRTFHDNRTSTRREEGSPTHLFLKEPVMLPVSNASGQDARRCCERKQHNTLLYVELLLMPFC